MYNSLYAREYSDVNAAKRGHEEIVGALRDGKYIGVALGYTPEETLRLAWLRAAEWLAWPGFISQPLLPILYLFWPWYYAIAWVALATVMWRFVRLAEKGANLLLAGRNEERLATLTSELGAETFCLDATDLRQVESCMKRAADLYVDVDGVANCVGSLLLKPAHKNYRPYGEPST